MLSETAATTIVDRFSRRKWLQSTGVTMIPILMLGCISLALVECQPNQASLILNQLNQLETRPSQSLDECAHWFNLNVEYRRLTGSRAPRKNEVRKKEECDNLEKFLSEAREKLAAVQQLSHSNGNQLQYVSGLVNEFLDLKYATGVSQELAHEFEALKQSDAVVRSQTDQLEQFLQFMVDTLSINLQQQAGSTGLVSSNRNVQPIASPPPVDQLGEIDIVLRQLIDREQTLNEVELEQLAELGGLLDGFLSSGQVDIGSGRFRYLSGTLDAVRATMVHTMAGVSNQPEE